MGGGDAGCRVEGPPGVAAGRQRVGRAGHRVGEPSKGISFPKFRGDLLEATVVVGRMHEGAVETTVMPRNPLDVLAQQLVAMTVLERALRRAGALDVPGVASRSVAVDPRGRTVRWSRLVSKMWICVGVPWRPMPMPRRPLPMP